MEELQTKTMEIPVGHKTITCQFKERDFGDYIVYDVLSDDDNYLFTISKQGDVLFNESDMNRKKTIMDPRELNELIDVVKERVIGDLD
jgi:hypothetical protein